jgi:hypothetical protein
MLRTGFVIVAPSQLGPPSPLLADNIDPRTKDFRDLFTGADPVDDRVQVTVMTTRGSGAAVLDTGISLTRNKMTTDIEDSLKSDVRQALNRQVKTRDIQLVDITLGGPDSSGQPTGTVDEANQTAQVNVQYRNLRALDPRVRSMQVSATPQVM